ncbi:hypothetical protein BOX15_Mlig010436g1, partial [Macrostomum lignano]
YQPSIGTEPAMEDLISEVSDIDFYIETQLEQQIGLQPLPYPGMDKSGSGVCTFYLRGGCHMGATCPFRHIKGDRTVVCKHWLRGLCKKGDDCEFLHEFDMSKMPECYFFTKFGQCLNKDCPFQHIDPNSKVRQCEWYDRGFCRNGPSCKMRHVRRVACVNYLNGFCPEGPDCQFAHPRWGQMQLESSLERRQSWLCRHCGERGHKVQFCFKLSEEERREVLEQIMARKAAEQQASNPLLNPQLKQPHAHANPALMEAAAAAAAATGRSHAQPVRHHHGYRHNHGDHQHRLSQHHPYHRPGLNRNRRYHRGGGGFQRNSYNRSRQQQQQHQAGGAAAAGGDGGSEAGGGGGPRPLSEVTCFKCGEKGHYANACHKGHLAFLSKADQEELKQQQEQHHQVEQPQEETAMSEAGENAV